MRSAFLRQCIPVKMPPSGAIIRNRVPARRSYAGEADNDCFIARALFCSPAA